MLPATGIDFLFGIILAVVVSNYVAHCLHPHGVYESELEEQNGAQALHSVGGWSLGSFRIVLRPVAS